MTRSRVLRALLIEDEPLVRWTLRRAVESEGLDVVEASSLAEGAHLWEQGAFTLVLTDYRLPDGSGAALLRIRRQHGDQTPAACITAESERVAGELEPGIPLLTKPLDPTVLRQTIHDLIAEKSQTVGTDSSACRTVGPFEIMSMPSEWDDVAMRHLESRATGSSYLACDCRMVSRWDDSVGPALETLSDRLRRRNGCLCVILPPGPVGAALAALCGRHKVETVAEAEDLERLGRRHVSQVERTALLTEYTSEVQP